MLVNLYYSNNVLNSEGGYTADDELIQMCGRCAVGADVTFAREGDETSICEYCEAANSAAHKAEFERQYNEVVGRRPATHIPTIGKYIYFDHIERVWFACHDGLKIDLHGYDNIEEARAAINEYVYDLLRRTAVETADNAAEYTEVYA